MKNILITLSFLLLLTSCEYLDVVPEGKATQDDIWKTTQQAEKYRYYMRTYMPNLIGYDWSPDQFAGDDMITGGVGTTYWFSSKSLIYGEENANVTYFGRWAPYSTSGVQTMTSTAASAMPFTCWTTSTRYRLSVRRMPPVMPAKHGI